MLPNVGENFAADALFPCFAIGHDAAGSGNDGDAEAVENLGDVILAGINAQAGLGNTLETGDNLLTVCAVLKGDGHHLLNAFAADGVTSLK